MLYTNTRNRRRSQGGAGAAPRARIPSNIAPLNIVLLQAMCIISAPEYAISDERTRQFSGEWAQFRGGGDSLHNYCKTPKTMVTKKVMTILGNREGREVTKVHTGTCFFPLQPLTTPLNAPLQRKSWLCVYQEM